MVYSANGIPLQYGDISRVYPFLKEEEMIIVRKPVRS